MSTVVWTAGYSDVNICMTSEAPIRLRRPEMQEQILQIVEQFDAILMYSRTTVNQKVSALTKAASDAAL